MNRSFFAVAFAALVCSATAPLFAAAYYDVSPADLSADFSTGFSWDTDMDAPIGVSSTGTVAGNSFWSNVTGVAPRKYTSIRIAPSAIGLTGLTIANITSALYDTRKDGGTYDWRLNIYTVKQAGQASGWYGYRLNFNPGDTANHPWTTYDMNTLNIQSLKNGWTNFEDYSATLAGAKVTTASLPIMWIEFIAGSNTPAPAVDAFLDNIRFTTTLGSANVNLVPEPASLGLIALGGIALLRRRRAN